MFRINRILSFMLFVLTIAAIFTGCSNSSANNSRVGAVVRTNVNGCSSQVTAKVVKLENGTLGYKWVSGEFTSSEKNQIGKQIKSTYKNVKEVRKATVKYNCHSYAWYSRSTSNDIWIEDIKKFTDNAELKKTQTSGFDKIPSGVCTNYRAVYYKGQKINHSAIVSNLTTTNEQMISKWGPYGLYYHSIKECPYYYANNVSIRYYKVG